MPGGTGRGRNRRIQDEAAAWHMRMLEPASEAEVAEFEAWLDAAPEHARAYNDFEVLTSRGANLPRDLLVDQPAVSKWTFQPAFGFAIGAILILFVGLWLTAPGAEPAYAAVSNPGPAVRFVRLGDGTEVILDAETELAVALGDDVRKIRISTGRARFTVASDKERPFSVSTPTTVVTARGTIFDVAYSGEETSVFVIKGVVDVAGSEKSDQQAATAVRSGEAVAMQGRSLISTSIHPSEARWPLGRFPFDNATLKSVVRIANRESDPDIAIRDDAVGELEVTGVFDIRDTRTLARKLAATHDLRVEESSGSIILTR